MSTMIATRLIVIAATVAVGACSRDAKITAESKPAIVERSGGSDMQEQRDGRSFDTAIVLPAKTQSEGVAAQGAWMEKNLPGARPAPPPKTSSDEEIVSFGQEIMQHDGKLYSVVHLEMPDGKSRDVYFDVTGYFGK